jgi:hypothetical protein
MAVGRIRSIKPTFPKDEALGACSRDARLLFASLWATCCDDFGKFRAAPALLRADVFPYDEALSLDDLALMLKELERGGMIRLYEAAGQKYGLVVNWAKHQRITNAGRSDFPDPPDSPQLAATRRDSPLERIGEERIGKDCGGLGQSLDTLGGDQTHPSALDNILESDLRCEETKNGAGAARLACGTPGVAGGGEDYEAEFEVCWEFFPRRGVGKTAARKAYVARRRGGVPAEVLLVATQNFARSMVAEGRPQKRIKQGSTFYGPDEHWSDYKDGVPEQESEYEERDPEYEERSPL